MRTSAQHCTRQQNHCSRVYKYYQIGTLVACCRASIPLVYQFCSACTQLSSNFTNSCRARLINQCILSQPPRMRLFLTAGLELSYSDKCVFLTRVRSCKCVERLWYTILCGLGFIICEEIRFSSSLVPSSCMKKIL